MIWSLPQTIGYGQGYARARAESRHPELWDGLVGLWAPVLGPTGDVLRNWSPHGSAHDGRLMNIAPADAWTLDRYGWALDVPAANGHVDCGTPSAMAFSGRPSFSVVALLSLHSLQPYGGIIDNSISSSVTEIRCGLTAEQSKLRLLIGDGTSLSWCYSDANVLSPNTWLHVGVTVEAGDRVVFYRNGVPCGARTMDRDLAPSTSSWKIGRAFGQMDSGFGLNGLISILAVYNRALAPNEMMRYTLAPAGPLHPTRRLMIPRPTLNGGRRVATGQTHHAGAACGETSHS